MQETTKKTIEKIYTRTQENFLQELHEAGDAAERLFEAFMQILILQEEDYSKLFEVPGFLPKDLQAVVNKLFCTWRPALMSGYKIKQLEDLADFSRLLASRIDQSSPFFSKSYLVQVKVVVDGKDESLYFIEPYKAGLTPGGLVWPDFTFWLHTRGVPVRTVLSMQVKRLPVTEQLIEDLLKKVCDDDNWQIEETDPIEHYQERVFQWDKAFGPFFEYAYGTQGPFSEANNASC